MCAFGKAHLRDMSGGRTVVEITPELRILMAFNKVMDIVSEWPSELQERLGNLIKNDKEMVEKIPLFMKEAELIRKQYRYQLIWMSGFIFILIGWPVLVLLLGLPIFISPMDYMPPPWIGYVHIAFAAVGFGTVMLFQALEAGVKHVMSAKEMNAFVMKLTTYIQQALQDNVNAIVADCKKLEAEARQLLDRLKTGTSGDIGARIQKDFPELYQVMQKEQAILTQLLEGKIPPQEEMQALGQEVERAHQLFQERYVRKQEQQG